MIPATVALREPPQALSFAMNPESSQDQFKSKSAGENTEAEMLSQDIVYE